MCPLCSTSAAHPVQGSQITKHPQRTGATAFPTAADARLQYDYNDHLNQVALDSPRSLAHFQLQLLVGDAVTVANELGDNAAEETARLVVDAVTVANELGDNEFVDIGSSSCMATHHQSMGEIEFRQMASQLKPTDLRKQLHEHSESGDLQKVSRNSRHISRD